MAELKKKWTALITIVGVSAAVITGLIFYANSQLGLGMRIPRYENLEYKSYDVHLTPSRDFVVDLTLRNTSTVNLTTDELFINATVWDERGDTIYENITGITLAPGQSESGILILSRGNTWIDGARCEITVMTLSGKEYTKTIMLP